MTHAPVPSWVDDVSVEVTTREARSAVGIVARGSRVFIPWLPKSTPEEIAEAAFQLSRAGLIPIPHVAARRLKDRAQAQELLERLSGECGVDSVLVVGGDMSAPAGAFESSEELAVSGVLQACGIRSFGCAGYPEGHPAIGEPRLYESLEKKLAYARQNGLDSFIVSQFCFDASAIVDWIRGLRHRGVTSPVRIGVAGPTNLGKLIQLAYRCGVGNTFRALRGRAGAAVRLASPYKPDVLLSDIENRLATGNVWQSTALHVFAFGGVELAAKWIGEHFQRTAKGELYG